MASDPYKDLLENLRAFKEEHLGDTDSDDIDDDEEFDMFADDYEYDEEVE